MSISSFNEFTNKEIESIYEIPVCEVGVGLWLKSGNALKFSKKLKILMFGKFIICYLKNID